MTHARIAVLGAGSWGTALSLLLARNGHEVMLWARDELQVSAMKASNQNEKYLPGFSFPPQLQVSGDIQATARFATDLWVVVPSTVFRDTLKAFKPFVGDAARIVWATKGLERHTAKFFHQVVSEELGASRAMAVISGPTFAKEVVQGLPTALTIASTHGDFAQELATHLGNDSFRAYTSTDMVGVQLGGAAKNVLAIAAGISDGLGFGANTRAALITRGLHEIVRLGEKLGGLTPTFMGLAGLGDIILTCTENQSRNRRLGLALAQGLTLAQACAQIHQVVEGIPTAEELIHLARPFALELPIIEQVHQVIQGRIQPVQAVRHLLARQMKAE